MVMHHWPRDLNELVAVMRLVVFYFPLNKAVVSGYFSHTTAYSSQASVLAGSLIAID
jgi:hypothetical protein